MKYKKQSIFKRWVLRKKKLSAIEQIHADREINTELADWALKKIFQRQAHAGLDGLNEYDEDYTAFIARGDLITHEMQRAIDRHADKKYPVNDDTDHVAEPVEDQPRKINDQTS